MAKKKVSKKTSDADGELFPPTELVKKAPKVPKVAERPRGPTAEEVQEAKAKIERCMKKAEGCAAVAMERMLSTYRHAMTSEGQVRNILRLEENHLAHETVRMLAGELTKVKPEDL